MLSRMLSFTLTNIRVTNMNIITHAELTPELARAGCFVTGMSNEAYHAYEGVSNSGLKLVKQSPSHYAYRSDFKETRNMEIGSAFHTALLEPERYAREYMTVKGVYVRTAAEYKAAGKVYGKDKTLTDQEGASVDVMVEAVRNNPDAYPLLSEPGYAELSAFVQDPETGVLLRCRYDWITNTRIVVDVKKTQDCQQRAFQRNAHSYGYHMQDAMYSHVFELITGEALESFNFLAIEEQPPCANILYWYDDIAKKQGHKEYRDALHRYAAAEKTGIWEGYDVTSDIISLPEWVLNEIEEELN